MKYDVQFKFTTDNSVMWVGITETATKKTYPAIRLTCDELAAMLIEHRNLTFKPAMRTEIGEH